MLSVAKDNNHTVSAILISLVDSAALFEELCMLYGVNVVHIAVCLSSTSETQPILSKSTSHWQLFF